DARIGALLHRIIHSVGLHGGIVEVESAEVEDRRIYLVLVVVGHQAIGVAAEVEIAGCQRPAGLDDIRAGQLPAPEDRIQRTVPAMAELAASTHRDLPDAIHLEAVWTILARDAVFRQGIGGIEQAEFLAQPRVSVRSVQRETGPESMLYPHFDAVVRGGSVVALGVDRAELRKWQQDLRPRYRGSAQTRGAH